MPKILVLFHSRTGNTDALADAVADALAEGLGRYGSPKRR
jgi:flavodoxin